MSTSTTASTVIGYARVSTVGQTLEQQTEALTAAGAGKIFHDVMSGARDDRPGFAECMRYLRQGDTLIVWRLDRLGHDRAGWRRGAATKGQPEGWNGVRFRPV